MNELGHILREARENRGLTLAEVEKQTRIRVKFLEALESGNYAKLPTPAHVRGFLRNYARFLDLDPQPLINRFQHTFEQQVTAVASATVLESTEEATVPLPAGHTFFDPVNLDVYDGRGRSSESVVRLVIIVALVIALGLVINRFVPLFSGNSDDTEALKQGITEAVQDLTSNIGTVDTALEPAPQSTLAASQPITSTSRNIPGELLPTPSPTRPQLPATMETIRLKLEITERTWMEVTIDGDVVFTGIAKKGDPPYEWEAEEEAKVVTGNAIGIVATVNDIQLGRLGGRGEDREEVWLTTR
ncbi:MAG: helix-turn-helix domain-containing protein [Anaerolineae bacterium]